MANTLGNTTLFDAWNRGVLRCNSGIVKKEPRAESAYVTFGNKGREELENICE